MKQSQEQGARGDFQSEGPKIYPEVSQENDLKRGYEAIQLEEKMFAMQDNVLKNEAEGFVKADWQSQEQFSNRTAEIELYRDEYRYEMSKDSVMRDLEKDIQKRQREKLLYALSMIGITLFVLLLPLFFREKEEKLPFSVNEHVSKAYSSSSSLNSFSGASPSSSIRPSTGSVVKNETVPSSTVHGERFAGPSFLVQVSVEDLNIRSEPQDTADIVGICPPGQYTIVEIHSNNGYTWGKLKSGKGWIALEYTDYMDGRSKKRVDTKNLTTQQVKNWVRVAYETTIKPYANVGDIREIDVRKEKDNLVYATVYEDQLQTEHLFRVSAAGYLEMKDIDEQWKVVLREYVE